MITIFGISLYEIDVTLTDLILCIETVIFAYLLYRYKGGSLLLQKLLVTLFASLSISSFLGALFHAFFPAKATTPEGFAIWVLIAASIGVTASVAWSLSALLTKGKGFLKKVSPLIVLYLISFLLTVIFVNYEFKTIIFFYSPPMVVLLFVSLSRMFFNYSPIWIYMFGGILLSFIAASIQYLKISIDPVYFNYNALYHTVQGLALALIFVASRSLLRNYHE